MSLANLVFGIGTLLLFFAQRWTVLGSWTLLITVLALAIAYLGGAGLRARQYAQTSDPGVRYAHRSAFAALFITLVALGLYGLTTDALVGRLELGDEMKSRWLGIWGWMWPMVWALGAGPLIALDWGIQSSPVMMPRRRVRALAAHGALLVLAVTLVFPINYVATSRNVRWDTAYFKTPTPGTATLALAESLEQPVDVRVFMPPASEVGLELRHYFEAFANPKVRLHMIDQAAEPRLAKALRVRENGIVTFTVGELDLEPVETEADAAATGPHGERKAVDPHAKDPHAKAAAGLQGDSGGEAKAGAAGASGDGKSATETAADGKAGGPSDGGKSSAGVPGEVKAAGATGPQAETKAEPTVGAKEDKPDPVTRELRINVEFDKAKKTLQKLDTEVQRLLIELGHGERVAYLTTGHGELQYTGRTMVLDRQMRVFKERLTELGFKVKSLGLNEGSALRVPEDADVVVIAGPDLPFQTAEVDALRTYLQGGGSLWVAYEPLLIREGGQAATHSVDPLETMVEEEIGLRLGKGVLAAEQAIVPFAHDLTDRFQIVTNSFTSHPSSRTLAANSSTATLFAPAPGYLEEIDGHASTLTFTVRSLAFTWPDLNLNAQHDAQQGESKGARNLVAAATGGDEKNPWRAIVSGDASILSDHGIRSRGNFMLIDDSLNWLIGAEELSGTTHSEEDVKIEHTKEGQANWFYLTVLGIPLGVMFLGGLRVRLRRRERVRRTVTTEKGTEA